jgi:hypothetical protein
MASPKKIVDTMKAAWPDGEVGLIDFDESYFWKEHLTIREKLQNIKGARLEYEREAEPERNYPDDDELEEFSTSLDEPRSYHLFFVCPSDNCSHYETEAEMMNDDEEMEMVPGQGTIGCAVAVSLVARFAVMNIASEECFENGIVDVPDIVNQRGDFRGQIGDTGLKRLDRLQAKVAKILASHEIEILQPDTATILVPGLTGNGEVSAGVEGMPITVGDALFFREIC